MESIKETGSNIGASAQSGLEKTKAMVEEKVEKMSTRDPVQKEMATRKKEERIQGAEMKKQEAREHNAASKQTGGDGGYSCWSTPPYTTTGGTHTHSTAGDAGQATGGHQMSALPGHGTGSPAGQVVEGTAGIHPIGTKRTETGAGGSTDHDTRVGPHAL